MSDSGNADERRSLLPFSPAQRKKHCIKSKLTLWAVLKKQCISKPDLPPTHTEQRLSSVKTVKFALLRTQDCSVLTPPCG